ncbi:hypothetical protein [Mycolicibacterium baixiangningiae]|uniref:hypothetical protein n=1 Tax=Mycolicibacterium baixiangningiae TaxID=2761578 RepID=UPI0018D12664|nr:hypothetical protein [Mycolicibacterium baixiangningiae]
MDLERLKFLWNQRVRGFDIGDRPWFDSEETTLWFMERLASATAYLEYGAGGSTYAAAKMGINFVTVDSDPYFLRSVRRKIEKDGFAHAHGQSFKFADIGPTGKWGRPVGKVTARRLRQFANYSDIPPEYASGTLIPDLVLVDGRFRVACALKATQMLRRHTGWTLVVDDYDERPEYHIIAEYAELTDSVGRMAVFTAAKEVDLQGIEGVIRSYENIP